MKKFSLSAILIVSVVALSGCGEDPKSAQPAAEGEPQTVLGKAIQQATEQARKEIASGNIDLSTIPGAPKAEITPQGDLLLDGKPVTVSAEQRALLLDYRQKISTVAIEGIAIGQQGADLAGKAIGEAVSGIFSGKHEEIGQKIEAEAKKIETSAMKLCDALPALMAAQDKLAAALPEFQPYAKLTQADIDDCGKNGGNGKNAFWSGHDVGQTVKEAVETIGSDVNRDTAAEAEAATAEPAKR